MGINRHNGFTLIELAMVLFILALLLGSFLTPLATSIEQRNRQTTMQQLEQIRQSLLGYALVHGHLPCPDCPDSTIGKCGTVNTTDSDSLNDGKEDGVDEPVTTATNTRDSTFVNCATEQGNLPWVTLDAPENDAWGNKFIYRVTDDFADNNDGTSTCKHPAQGVSFCLGSVADINIKDASNKNVAEKVPAVVVSSGKNGANASTLEQENRDDNKEFIAADYRRESGKEFDDLVIWITPHTLMFQMVKAERLP